MPVSADATSQIQVGARAPVFAAFDETGDERSVPETSRPPTLIFSRGAWCPWCNGPLAALARRLDVVVPPADPVIFGISSDPPARSHALRRKLLLPFSLLSDPDGSAIR